MTPTGTPWIGAKSPRAIRNGRGIGAVVPGIYQPLVRLRRPVTIRVGVLGRVNFLAGWYVYTGSARNGLHQRIRRHLRRETRKHWHIGYLLAVADDLETFVMPGTTVTECQLHGRLSDGEVVVPGFGSSDCRRRSHLARFRGKPRVGLTPWRLFLAVL